MPANINPNPFKAQVCSKNGEINVVSASAPSGLELSPRALAANSGVLKTQGTVSSKDSDNAIIDYSMAPLYATAANAAAHTGTIKGYVMFTDTLLSHGSKSILQENAIFALDASNNQSPSIQFNYATLANSDSVYYPPSTTQVFPILTAWGEDAAANNFALQYAGGTVEIIVSSDDNGTREVKFNATGINSLLLKDANDTPVSYFYNKTAFSWPGDPGKVNGFQQDYGSVAHQPPITGA